MDDIPTFAIRDPRSAIRDPRSAIRDPRSAIRDPSGTSLVLTSPDPESFIARLEAPDVTAEVLVIHYQGDRLAEFFADLAASWRGWEGERAWRSTEDALAFHA